MYWDLRGYGVNLLNPSSAAQIKDAPTKAYLYRVVKKEDRPEYFYHDGTTWMIDIDHPEWLALLRKRAKGKVNIPNDSAKENKLPATNVKTTMPPVKPPKNTNTDSLDLADLKKLKLQADLEEKNIKNGILYLEMQKKSGNIIDFELAKYLFFSYMEKANVDFLRMAKKNEALIDNFVKENNTRGVVNLVEQEVTMILREVTKSQKEALDKWVEEESMGSK